MIKQFAGTIDYDWYEKRIILREEDGNEIDLIQEFENIKAYYADTKIQVSHWLSPIPVTKEEALEELLKQLYFGELYAEHTEDQVCWSTWTGCDSYYEATLTVGGHSLLDELSGKDGMFVIIEVELQNGE